MISAINTWISLLLLCYVQFAGGFTNRKLKWKQCLTNCSCAEDRMTWYTIHGPQYIFVGVHVDCQGRTDVDSGRLSEEIDSMLSSNLVYANSTTLLRIVNSPLTHVPRSICRLTTLTELRLDNNQLTRLPDNCLTNLSNLVRFTASNNAIEMLQDGVFEGLTKLQYLYLNWNKIRSIDGVFKGLTKLQYLGLRRNQISSIDLSILAASTRLSSGSWTLAPGRLESYRTRIIDLTHNNIVKLSKYTNENGHQFLGLHGICYIESPTTYVKLSCNKILTSCSSTLRSAGENFTAIGLIVNCQRQQDVDGEQLSEELDSMLSMNLMYGRLLSLSIVNSSLTHVPRSICRLTTLTELHLGNNQLTLLPNNCLANLSNLIWFNASYNPMETLQNGVFDGLAKLRYLHLNWSRISSIGSSVFANLYNLTVLSLDNNQLTRLPDKCFYKLSNLLTLTASNNRIEILQDGVFDTLAELKYLNFSNNIISSVGSLVFAQLSNLRWLYLDNNRLTRLPNKCLEKLSNLETFTASGNAIETLQDGVFEGLTKLQYLDLRKNKISSIGLTVFAQLSNLRLLHLDNNQLTRLPDNCLTNLSNLETFTASDNAIETLQDGVFQGLTKLQYLDLRRNKISSIGLVVFVQLFNLRLLHLDNNQLTRLPDNSLTNLSNLVRFRASNNAIETLQDGVFQGLTKLQYLDLSRNKIRSIGLSVFATSSNLSSLFTISLSENNLTSLEPWIYDRCAIGNYIHKVRIDLRFNEIYKFTNQMGRHILDQDGHCLTNKRLHVNLTYNKIQHTEDILHGWQMNVDKFFRCSKNRTGLWQNLNSAIDTRHNNILCDCVNYNYYRILAFKNQQENISRDWWRPTQFQPYYWAPFHVQSYCNLTDPLTGKSSVVNISEHNLDLFACELTERCPEACVCVHRPANATLHVYCSNRNLRVLPLELPELPDSRTKYKLDFSNNKLLRRLEYRDYFVNTSILDVSNCSVDDVSDWEEIIVKTPEKLNLANNLWDCSCDNEWMIDFFSSIAGLLISKVECHSPSRLRGKNIIQSSENEFCVDPASVAASEAASEATRRALIISISSVAGVVVVLLSVGVIMYRLRVKLYTRWKFHPFDRDECTGEDMDYDVFISSNSTDNLPHGNSIREQLEQRGYRVCYPPRDFLGGATISENIYNAVVRSKRTVCLLTEDFCQSSYCMYEFEVAHHHNIMVKRKKRLIVLMALDNPNDLYANNASDTATLRQYLRQHTYIDYKADDWLDNLLYALPLHGMDERNLAGAEQEPANDTE